MTQWCAMPVAPKKPQNKKPESGKLVQDHQMSCALSELVSNFFDHFYSTKMLQGETSDRQIILQERNKLSSFDIVVVLSFLVWFIWCIIHPMDLNNVRQKWCPGRALCKISAEKLSPPTCNSNEFNTLYLDLSEMVSHFESPPQWPTWMDTRAALCW